VINEELKKSVGATIKILDKARRAAGALTKAKEPGLTEALPLVEKTIDALRAVRLDDLLRDLDQQRAELNRLADQTLARRREGLLRAAKEAGWRTRRMQDYDNVDCFRVNYKRTRVTLQLGSETLDAFDELDGQKVFVRMQESRLKLDSFPFSREAFFKAIRDAIGSAKMQGLDRDGKVAVRKLYALFVLVRQSHDEAFMKRPSTRSLNDYSICQFIYDLARFGKSGWKVNHGERLASQTPNMGTITKGEAITLPVLGGEGRGTQLATLWIEKA
jgi:hypothetical protein